jgi:hypothetical protein
MDSVEKLKALLAVDESGEEIASILNECLIDENKRDMLMVMLNEAKKSGMELRQDVRLTGSQETVKDQVLSSDRPLSALDVTDMAPSYLPSLKHRSHTSTVLNSLVAKGLLGKMPFGNVVYFSTPREAVMEQLKRRKEAPAECSPQEIVGETGLPMIEVLEILKDLVG